MPAELNIVTSAEIYALANDSLEAGRTQDVIETIANDERAREVLVDAINTSTDEKMLTRLQVIPQTNRRLI